MCWLRVGLVPTRHERWAASDDCTALCVCVFFFALSCPSCAERFTAWGSRCYAQVVELARLMFMRCRLVHADLSEYNVLYHEKVRPCVCGQHAVVCWSGFRGL